MSNEKVKEGNGLNIIKNEEFIATMNQDEKEVWMICSQL